MVFRIMCLLTKLNVIRVRVTKIFIVIYNIWLIHRRGKNYIHLHIDYSTGGYYNYKKKKKNNVRI